MAKLGKYKFSRILCLAAVVAVGGGVEAQPSEPGPAAADAVPLARPAAHVWKVHDRDRPLPPVVTPGNASTQDRAGSAPADAVVLYDGRSPDADLSAWTTVKADSPGWKLGDGYFEVEPGAGWIRTAESFGDCQVHLEWYVPLSEQNDTGQGRGNSGLFLMGFYEVQIGDHLQTDTYADGMAAAVYGQAPPLVNAGLGVGHWQTYDIVFRAPRFDDAGQVTRPGTITVLHNGVLVQDHWWIEGETFHKRRAAYATAHGEAPISLQDHGDPVRFRNVWVRRLAERPVSAVEAAALEKP